MKVKSQPPAVAPVGPCALCGRPLYGPLVLIAHRCCAFWRALGATWCIACAAAKTPSHGAWLPHLQETT